MMYMIMSLEEYLLASDNINEVDNIRVLESFHNCNLPLNGFAEVFLHDSAQYMEYE